MNYTKYPTVTIKESEVPDILRCPGHRIEIRGNYKIITFNGNPIYTIIEEDAKEEISEPDPRKGMWLDPNGLLTNRHTDEVAIAFYGTDIVVTSDEETSETDESNPYFKS
ncbi:MAG: hypothetical protein ACE5J4_02920 [Candidatus Aenigmatarchaeota archaeon]